MMLAAPATLLTAAVTLLTILIAIGTAILVARTRRTTGIQPPAMSGDPRLERALRPGRMRRWNYATAASAMAARAWKRPSPP